MAAAKLNLSLVRGTDFGPVQIFCKDSADAAVPLAGWKAYAEVRKTPDDSVVFDLAPEIAADDVDGLVTIPAIAHADSLSKPLGGFKWDLILEDPAGKRIPYPIVAGTFTIARTITDLSRE